MSEEHTRRSRDPAAHLDGPKGSGEDQSPAGQQLSVSRRMSQIKHKIIVLSGKGGVGKSTVAVNLAVAAAHAGMRTGVLDVDIHGPSVPKLLGIEGHHPVSDGESIRPVEADPNLKVMSIGFLLGGGDDPVIWRGPLKHTAIRQLLGEVEWGELDLLVVDSPPGTGDEPLSVIQLIENATGAVVVTTPQELAVIDVRKCIVFCRQLSLPVLGVIENMSGFVCPTCGARTRLFGEGGGEQMAADMGVPLLGKIPIDPAIAASGDAGTPLAGTQEDTPAARLFREAIEKLFGQKGGLAMRYAVPLTNGVLSAHFGHCEEFAFVDVDGETKTVGEVTRATSPPHEPGALPAWLRQNGADIIIAGGMGRRAQGLFAESGIQVIVGAHEAPPEELVTAHLNGALQAGTNLCDH